MVPGHGHILVPLLIVILILRCVLPWTSIDQCRLLAAVLAHSPHHEAEEEDAGAYNVLVREHVSLWEEREGEGERDRLAGSVRDAVHQRAESQRYSCRDIVASCRGDVVTW